MSQSQLPFHLFSHKPLSLHKLGFLPKKVLLSDVFFFTPADPLFSTTKQIVSLQLHYQGEKGSADFELWPCDLPYFNTVFSTPKLTSFRFIFNEVKSTKRFKFNQ